MKTHIYEPIVDEQKGTTWGHLRVVRSRNDGVLTIQVKPIKDPTFHPLFEMTVVEGKLCFRQYGTPYNPNTGQPQKQKTEDSLVITGTDERKVTES